MAQFSISGKIKGYVVSNLFAMVTMTATKYMLDNQGGDLVFAEFVIIPAVMGMICAWHWRFEELSGKNIFGRVCLDGLIAIALSAIFLHEGAICLVIVSPLILALIATGHYLGRKLFNRNNTTLNISVVSLLILAFVLDVRSTHHYENMVSDTITVNAPVQKVWPLVVAYKRIEKPDGYFLSRLGMPTPVQSTVTGYHVGAGRKCIFSNGYVFDEKITTYDENHNLTFAITNQPRDPEIMGHIDIEQGQFILKDNGNGTTTLIGNSWYKLHVFPVWYFDRWAESITRNVHLRVMDHIKTLAEQP